MSGSGMLRGTRVPPIYIPPTHQTGSGILQTEGRDVKNVAGTPVQIYGGGIKKRPCLGGADRRGRFGTNHWRELG